MRHLSIDIETFSDEPIAKTGLYRYAQSPAFDILLFGYSFDGASPCVLDLTTNDGREKLMAMVDSLYDANTIKHAWNAAFEWYCLSVWLRRRKLPELPPEQWWDTMLHALYCGLPGSLEACGIALDLPNEKKKLAAGKALIRTFSVPRKPTARNPSTRTLPQDEPEKWALYKTYNQQDVVTETTIDAMLSPWPVPDGVQRQWVLDLRQNLRGVGVDIELVHGALVCATAANAALLQESRRLTGLANPKSTTQLLGWLRDRLGGAAPKTLDKDTVSGLLPGISDPLARRVLGLRLALAKTSTKKYDAMALAACADGRLRGIMQFYGASRTGRYAGRLVQPQNLPRTHLANLDLARALTREGNYAALCMGWGADKVNDALSQLLRTALVPRAGNRYIDADFSAIEARVVAWLAGERWVLEVFCTTGKIYEATAAQMFGVPVEKIVKGTPEYELRQRGKVAQLACGYQGGAGAMARMDTAHKIDPAEYPALVQKWRDANPHIVALWRETENAALAAMQGAPTWVQGKVRFALETTPGSELHFLTALLPSGRKLFYFRPHLSQNRFGRPCLHYMGVAQQSRKWETMETYGGKLVENLVQGIARDLLCEKIEALEAQGYPVVFSVHDEVIVERPASNVHADFESVKSIMSESISWAQGLPLNADGWVGDYYTKD